MQKIVCFKLLLISTITFFLTTPSIAKEYKLSFTKTSFNKHCFKLNNKNILPVILTQNVFLTSRKNIIKAKMDGFNILYLPIDSTYINTFENKIKSLLKDCIDENIPVIIEISLLSYWGWLPKNKDCNMKFSNGDYVHYYPDFKNPKAKDEYLIRVSHILEFFRPYFYRPIVAISIGPYDFYHVPEVEEHLLFKTPFHTKQNQTYLPFGEYVLADFKNYLKEKGANPVRDHVLKGEAFSNGVNLEEIGFKNFNEVYLPESLDDARNEKHWNIWMEYRKFGYTLNWTKEVVEYIKEYVTGIPITMTLDVTALMYRADDWATPDIEYYYEIFDFLIIYYYKEDFANQLKKILNRKKLKIPLISLLEFSSDIGGEINAKNYIEHSLPYVSGFHFMDRGMKRYKDFVNRIKEIKVLR